MTAYEEHLLLRKQLRQATVISRIVVFALVLIAFAIDYIRVFGG